MTSNGDDGIEMEVNVTGSAAIVTVDRVLHMLAQRAQRAQYTASMLHDADNV
eukprot:COSAG01_NODE_51321_length_355_cov_2.226562_1_plen_51_part_10